MHASEGLSRKYRRQSLFPENSLSVVWIRREKVQIHCGAIFPRAKKGPMLLALGTRKACQVQNAMAFDYWRWIESLKL